MSTSEEERELLSRTRNENSKHHEKRTAARILKDWNLKFNGTDKESLTQFLAEVKDCYKCSGLTFQQLIYGLSGIFKGEAEIWYRTEKSSIRK